MTTVAVAPRSPGPLIRLRPAPQCEPPFDDEREPAPRVTAHQLALPWPSGTDSPDPPRSAAATTAGHVTGAVGTDSRAGRDSPRPEEDGGGAVHQQSLALTTAAGASSDAKLAVRKFVAACVEVLNGYRPATHLRRLALPTEAARVVAQAVTGAHRVAELRGADPRRPVPRARRRPSPVGVLRVHLCAPGPGAVEASVVLVTGERTWALALRLEMHQQTWVATALRLI